VYLFAYLFTYVYLFIYFFIYLINYLLCHWGDLGVDGWIILGWISRRWDVGIWIGLGWPRIGTGGGCL
jgi:hypothetical protein